MCLTLSHPQRANPEGPMSVQPPRQPPVCSQALHRLWSPFSLTEKKTGLSNYPTHGESPHPPLPLSGCSGGFIFPLTTPTNFAPSEISLLPQLLWPSLLSFVHRPLRGRLASFVLFPQTHCSEALVCCRLSLNFPYNTGA